MSAKVNNAYFSIAIITYASLTLALHLLYCMYNWFIEFKVFSAISFVQMTVVCPKLSKVQRGGGLFTVPPSPTACGGTLAAVNNAPLGVKILRCSFLSSASTGEFVLLIRRCVFSVRGLC